MPTLINASPLHDEEAALINLGYLAEIINVC